MKPKRLNRPWTPHDLKRMREMARRGASAKRCAVSLQRTRGAVAYKAMVERVRFHACEQPPGVQRKATRTRRRNARLAGRAT